MDNHVLFLRINPDDRLDLGRDLCYHIVYQSEGSESGICGGEEAPRNWKAVRRG